MTNLVILPVTSVSFLLLLWKISLHAISKFPNFLDDLITYLPRLFPFMLWLLNLIIIGIRLIKKRRKSLKTLINSKAA